MITEDDIKKAWNEYYRYREDNFGGPGNGCDDYRDIPAEIINKLRVLEDTARKIQKEYDKQQGYVDNDVFKFRIDLKSHYIEKTIYTQPFPEYPPLGASNEEYRKFYDDQEDLVQEKYFTKERIQELKDYFCKLIQEDENPFYISCVDKDSGYRVTEKDLFNLD